MQTPRKKTVDSVTRWAGGLRFPTLVAVFGGLFLLDLLIPDVIPLVDEILLALLTLLLATLRRKPKAKAGDEGRVTIDVGSASANHGDDNR